MIVEVELCLIIIKLETKNYYLKFTKVTAADSLCSHSNQTSHEAMNTLIYVSECWCHIHNIGERAFKSITAVGFQTVVVVSER